MNRLVRSLLWLLLVPYFAVVSLNVAPWVGSRENANRTNGQLAAAFILVSLEIALLALAGLAKGGVWEMHLYVVMVMLFLPPLMGIALWVNRAREIEYRHSYHNMPVGVRLVFGMVTVTLVVGCWWAVGRS